MIPRVLLLASESTSWLAASGVAVYHQYVPCVRRSLCNDSAHTNRSSDLGESRALPFIIAAGD